MVRTFRRQPSFLNKKRNLLPEKQSLVQLVQLNWKKDLLLEGLPRGIIWMLLTIQTIEHMMKHVTVL